MKRWHTGLAKRKPAPCFKKIPRRRSKGGTCRTFRNFLRGLPRGGESDSFSSEPCGFSRRTSHRESQRAGASGRPAHADRKSTRLNSSHSQISYAVFCL